MPYTLIKSINNYYYYLIILQSEKSREVYKVNKYFVINITF